MAVRSRREWGSAAAPRESGTADIEPSSRLAYCRSILFANTGTRFSVSCAQAVSGWFAKRGGATPCARTPLFEGIIRSPGPSYAGVAEKHSAGAVEMRSRKRLVAAPKCLVVVAKPYPSLSPRLWTFRETASEVSEVEPVRCIVCRWRCCSSLPARIATEHFDYVFCNKTNIKVFVAVATLVSPRDSRFRCRAGGRSAQSVRQCRQFSQGLGLLLRRAGRPGNRLLGRRRCRRCVAYPGPFERILTQNLVREQRGGPGIQGRLHRAQHRLDDGQSQSAALKEFEISARLARL